jgi:microcystin-dependent protein
MPSEPLLGTVMPFAGNFAPNGWAFCNGQLLSIAENTALFALIGTTYGGDGISTFALPDLRGRVPLHQGQGAGLPAFAMGQSGGEENHTLSGNELPAHTHLLGSGGAASTTNPATNAPAVGGKPTYATPGTGNMAAGIVGATGGSQPHNNLQPYLAINFVIALEGIFPPRS